MPDRETARTIHQKYSKETDQEHSRQMLWGGDLSVCFSSNQFISQLYSASMFGTKYVRNNRQNSECAAIDFGTAVHFQSINEKGHLLDPPCSRGDIDVWRL
jgi:hypothetical protein